MTEHNRERSAPEISELIRMVEKLIINQDRQKIELETKILSIGVIVDSRLDKLQKMVVGDGDEGAIVVRLREVERRMKDQSAALERLEEESRENREFQESWRNRIIGIMIAFPVITALLVIVVAYILGIAAAP
jgi:hypothetical protein